MRKRLNRWRASQKKVIQQGHGVGDVHVVIPVCVESGDTARHSRSREQPFESADGVTQVDRAVAIAVAAEEGLPDFDALPVFRIYDGKHLVRSDVMQCRACTIRPVDRYRVDEGTERTTTKIVRALSP